MISRADHRQACDRSGVDRGDHELGATASSPRSGQHLTDAVPRPAGQQLSRTQLTEGRTTVVDLALVGGVDGSANGFLVDRQGTSHGHAGEIFTGEIRSRPSTRTQLVTAHTRRACSTGGCTGGAQDDCGAVSSTGARQGHGRATDGRRNAIKNRIGLECCIGDQGGAEGRIQSQELNALYRVRSNIGLSVDS